MNKKKPRIEDIRRLYFDEQLSVKEVAKRLGTTVWIVIDAMDENGMKCRSASDAQKLRYDRQRGHIPLAEVLRLYFDEQQGIAVIAKKYRCSFTHIKTMIEEAGHKVRSRSEATYIATQNQRILFTDKETDEIVRLYTVEKVSNAYLANKFRVSTPVMSRFLKSQNITLRSSGEQRKIQGSTRRKPPELTAPETVEKLEPAEVNPEKVHELRYVENKSLAEIAEMAGLSTVEIYSLLGGK